LQGLPDYSIKVE